MTHARQQAEGRLDWLCRHAIFRRLDLEELGETRHFWRRRTLSPGQLLWREGAVARSLALVLSGELATLSQGRMVGAVHPGQLLGETSAFVPGTMRSATVRATSRTRLLVLPVAALAGLRAREHGLYDALLDEALRAQARRIQDTDQRIARSCSGDAERPARRKVPLLRLVQRWGAPRTDCPPLLMLLRRHPGLADVPQSVLVALTQDWRPEALHDAEPLCLEGDSADCAWVLAAGQLDVYRNVKGQQARRLTRLGRGSLVGGNALLTHGRRTASLVARGPSWVYRIPSASFRAPPGQPGRIIKESVFATLTAQLRVANAALGGPVASKSDLAGLERQRLAAWGALEGIECQDTLSALSAIIAATEE